MAHSRRCYPRCQFSITLMKLFSCLLLLIQTIVGLVGCAGTPSKVELPPVPAARLTPILNMLQARYNLTGSLKITKMMVTIQEGEQREELRELLWYKKSETGGDLLHIQALGGFNEPRGIAIANEDKNQFLLRLISEQKAYVGDLSDGVLREIFGIDLRVSDVLSAIFANPFLDKRTDNLTAASSGAKFIITRPGIQAGDVETITLFMREGEPRVTDWRIHDKSGMLQQRAAFEDYREVGGIFRPYKVEIERPIEQTRVVVKIANVQLNVDIQDSKFEQDTFLKGDVEIIHLSESANSEEP